MLDPYYGVRYRWSRDDKKMDRHQGDKADFSLLNSLVLRKKV